jgi:hypothetical protein
MRGRRLAGRRVCPADGSSDWEAAGRSSDGAEWVLDAVSNAGTHLVRAATYARCAGFWPGASAFAAPINEISKVVFSKSLTSADRGRDFHRDLMVPEEGLDPPARGL